jgi:release factor glutamine methyltransferase
VQERVPLQYLVGAAHWRDLVLAVGPGVLIPRPETEQLIDFVEEELVGSPSLAGAPWADLGCGSGVCHRCDGCVKTL